MKEFDKTVTQAADLYSALLIFLNFKTITNLRYILFSKQNNLLDNKEKHSKNLILEPNLQMNLKIIESYTT